MSYIAKTSLGSHQKRKQINFRERTQEMKRALTIALVLAICFALTANTLAYDGSEKSYGEYHSHDNFLFRATPPTSHCAGYTMSIINQAGGWDSYNDSYHRYFNQYIWKCNRSGCNGTETTLEWGPLQAHSWRSTWLGGHVIGTTKHILYKECGICYIVIDTTVTCPGNPCISIRGLE